MSGSEPVRPNPEPTVLAYDTPAPLEPPRTGRAVLRILIGSIMLGFGLLIALSASFGLLRMFFFGPLESFAVMGMSALLLLALGLTLSGLMNIVIAIQWLRRAPESESRILRVWRRINSFGARR